MIILILSLLAQVPFVGSLSFHKVAVIVAGAFTTFSCLLCLFLIFRHATHFAIPKEQKQWGTRLWFGEIELISTGSSEWYSSYLSLPWWVSYQSLSTTHPSTSNRLRHYTSPSRSRRSSFSFLHSSKRMTTNDKNSSNLLAWLRHMEWVALHEIYPTPLTEGENRHLCLPIPCRPINSLRRHRNHRSNWHLLRNILQALLRTYLDYHPHSTHDWRGDYVCSSVLQGH